MRRAVLILEGTLLALIEAGLVVFIGACVILIGQRVHAQTAVSAYVPPIAPRLSVTWTVARDQEPLLVSAMRGGRHCWVYTPLGLDAAHRHPRALESRALCSGL